MLKKTSFLSASILAFFLSCAGDFKEITDEERQAKLSSSSADALILCIVGDYCFENIHAETCLHSLQGMLAANCPASSSSSADVASGSSSSGALASSSSQDVFVSCQVGPDCISPMPDFICAYAGYPVTSCPISSSSVFQSSNSSGLEGDVLSSNSNEIVGSSSSSSVVEDGDWQSSSSGLSSCSEGDALSSSSDETAGSSSSSSEGSDGQSSSSSSIASVELTCNTGPILGIEGKEITARPALVCNNGASASNETWIDAPTWSNPEAGTYNISVTADCGTTTGLTANCSGTLDKCGARKEIFNTDFYECGTGTESNWIYLKGGVSGGTNDNAVLIGTQTWMASNLNIVVGTSTCYSGSTCDTYGRLYNWATAMNGANSSNANPSGVQGICPQGWHLPSDTEWNILITAVGGESTAGKKLKSPSNNYWTYDATHIGTNDYGFSALAGGSCAYTVSTCNYQKSYGMWWSSTTSSSSNLYWYMRNSESKVTKDSNANGSLYSIRCVKN